MAWYGPIFVTLGQVVWLQSLKLCDPSTISIFTSFMFVLNMAWAAVILSRYPTNAEYLGGSIILLSVVSGLLEKRHDELLKKKGGIEEHDEEEPPKPIEKEDDEEDSSSLQSTVKMYRMDTYI